MKKPLLTLAGSEFIVYSLPHDKYDIIYRTPHKGYKQLTAHNEQELKNCIRIWTEAKYIEHSL